MSMNELNVEPNDDLQPENNADATVEKPSRNAQQHMRSARRRARELAVQGVYQWLLNPVELGEIDAHVRDAPGFQRADVDHYQSLFNGAIRGAQQLEVQLTPHIDRPWIDLSPVEKSVLLIAAHELNQHLEIPYRVVINEALELTKTFGGTDAHKFVNGVLDKLAVVIRAQEIRPKN